MALTKKGEYWHFDFWFKGRRYQGSTHQTNKNKAILVEGKVRSDVALEAFGVGPAKQSPAFKDFLAEDGAFLEFVNRHAKARRTAGFYRDKAKRLLSFSPWLTMRLADIDGEVIERYVSFRLREVSATAVNGELATLRKALRLAEEWKLIGRAPRVRLLPGIKGREFVVDGDLEAAYLAVADYPLKQAAILILDIGIRPEECVRVRKEDISSNTLLIRRGKTSNAARNLPLTDRAICQIETLGRLWPNSEWLFPGRKGKHFTRGALDNLHSALRKANEWPAEFVLYSFRHTFGTRLAESGASLFQITALMGHRDIRMSSRYIHPQSEGLELAMKRKEMLDKTIRGIIPADSSEVAPK